MQSDSLRWDSDGLLPVVIQHAASGEVLTLAYANRAALDETVRTKETVLYSRSRKALWKKGETSGNTQTVESVSYDCDSDALLYRVLPSGPACHTGHESCFHNDLQAVGSSGAFRRAIAMLEKTLQERKGASPSGSYVAGLYAKGLDAMCQKVGEEAVEVVIAAKNGSRAEIIGEASDLLFHLLVLLAHADVNADEIGAELLRRSPTSP